MTPVLKVDALPPPASRPHPDAINSFGGGEHRYDSDFWEFEYQTFRYLGRVSDKKVVDRHREIVRNMSALTTSDRDSIPIQSFLSSWYWFRKEHQTRLECFLRGMSIAPPRLAQLSAKPNDAPRKPQHPNAGDVLFRYGPKQYLGPMRKEGSLRVFRASKQRETPADEARFDDECAKTRFMPGEYTQIGTPNGRPYAVHGDLSRNVSGPDYYMLCMSCDWDAALFDDFSKSDSCLIVTDPEKFVSRLEAAMQTILPAPNWYFHHNPVEYFDPYEAVHNGYFDSVMCKNFRFAYQREYRILWFPLRGERTENYKDIPALGSLESITELHLRPETPLSSCWDRRIIVAWADDKLQS